MSRRATLALAVAVVLSTAAFGCGSAQPSEAGGQVESTLKQEEAPALGANQVLASEVAEEFADLADEDGVITAPDLEGAGYEEISALSVAEVRAVCAVYMDDYRSTYGVDADYEMEDGDWETVKVFILYQLTGRLPEGSGSGSREEAEQLEELASEVEAAELEDFREFVVGMAQDAGDDELAAEAESASAEELEELKSAYAALLRVGSNAP